MLSRRLVFLGSGTSTGVPTLGCDCSICRSSDPRNKRTRPSVLVRLPQGDLLFDTTPDMRSQLLREDVGFVKGIVFTHDHADHLLGFDDIRVFPKHLGGPVPIFCEKGTEDSIRRVFYYAFLEETQKYPAGSVPKVQFQRIEPNVPFEFLGQRLLPLRLDHGKSKVMGFRMDNLAYCTDVKRIPEESLKHLRQLDVLILDALRFEPHPTHLCLQEALDLIDLLKPRRAFLTHLSHAFDHEKVESILPKHVRLAYDGLALEF